MNAEHNVIIVEWEDGYLKNYWKQFNVTIDKNNNFQNNNMAEKRNEKKSKKHGNSFLLLKASIQFL